MGEHSTPDRSGRVVLGLAGGRVEWTARLSRWAMSATADVDFLRCLSGTEVRAVLGAGRPVTALLLDASVVDRDLIDLAHGFGVPTALVHSGGPAADWVDLGCVALLREPVAPTDVLDLLDEVEARSAPPRPVTRRRVVDLDGPPEPATLIAVTGAGGSGVTTVTMLLAHALATRPPTRPVHGRQTAVVDATSSGGLGLYHDLVDPRGGVADLIELHRRDRVDPDEVRALSDSVEGRPYLVVAGDVHGGADRTTTATASAVLDGLRRTFATVVVDAGSLTGTPTAAPESLRSVAVRDADVVVAVGRSGLHGVHRLAVCLDEVLVLRGPGAPVVTVCTAAPRSPGERRAVAVGIGRDRADVVFIPVVTRLERVHRDVGPLPTAVAEALAGPVRARVAS